MKSSEKNELEKNSIIVLFLTIFGSAINYLCQILMGKFFSIDHYGIINLVFSLILIISVIGNTAFMLIAKSLSRKREDDYNIYKYIVKLANFSVIIVFVFALFYYSFLYKMLGEKNSITLITLFCVVSSIYPILYQGVYAATCNFLKLGLYTLILPLVKIIGLLICYYIKIPEYLELYAILLLIILGNFISIFIGEFSSKKYFGNKKIEILKQNDLKQNFISILVTNSLLMFLMNADVLALGYFYNTEIVGLYSSVLIFGKIVYYFITAFVTVMLPLIAKNDRKEDNKKVLYQTLFYTFVLTIIVLIPLNLFSNSILGLFFGNKYDGAVKYMIYASVVCLSYSLNVLLVNYLVGINQVAIIKKRFAIGVLMLIFILFLLKKNSCVMLLSIAVINFIIFLTNLIYITKSKEFS